MRIVTPIRALPTCIDKWPCFISLHSLSSPPHLLIPDALDRRKLLQSVKFDANNRHKLHIRPNSPDGHSSCYPVKLKGCRRESLSWINELAWAPGPVARFLSESASSFLTAWSCYYRLSVLTTTAAHFQRRAPSPCVRPGSLGRSFVGGQDSRTEQPWSQMPGAQSVRRQRYKRRDQLAIVSFAEAQKRQLTHEGIRCPLIQSKARLAATVIRREIKVLWSS